MVITVGDVVNATWSPPPAAWLNFTNCSAAAAWLAAYGQLYEDEGSLWDGVSFDIVIGYLGSMIPRNWTKPTDANLLVWYHEKNYFRDNNALLMDMINFPLSKCSAQVCPKLQWEGDPDLTGVGVSATLRALNNFSTNLVRADPRLTRPCCLITCLPSLQLYTLSFYSRIASETIPETLCPQDGKRDTQSSSTASGSP